MEEEIRGEQTMYIPALDKKNQDFFGSISGAVLFLAAMLLGLSGITGCSSSISAEEVPGDFIREYIAKHETMVDKSLVYYYAKEDQPEIARRVDTACRISSSKGMMEKLANASFDFSGLRIDIVDEKEDHVNDEPVVFVRVIITGSYDMQMAKDRKTVHVNENIVLRKAHHEWKVSESCNPWS